MYETFYGLKERPFNLTPDPKYLYLSDKHKEAFAHLLYGIRNRSGFVMVTGEIGTGKTTICRNLLNQLDPSTEVAFIFNPALNPVELLRKICGEFGVVTSAESLLELTELLNGHLLEVATQQRSCVLVIDEAQNLSPQVLEQIRLLSNLETETEKLLQIILVGQPELAEKLTLQELRQLNQRITARYHLKPLNEMETLQYIAYRLHVGGGRKKIHFAKSAIRMVYKLSGGTPRLINAICDRTLLIGYTLETHVITKAIVKRAAKEIRGEKVGRPKSLREKSRGWLPSPVWLAAIIVVLLGVQYFALPINRFAHELSIFNTFLSGKTPAAANNDTGAPPGPASTPEDTTKLAAKVADVLVESDPMRKVVQRLANPENSVAKTDTADWAAQLASLDPVAARNAAAAGLLGAWNMAPVSGYPENDEPATLVAFVQQNGLMAELLSPALEQLISLDLPAFIRLKSGEKTLWASLLSVTPNQCTLTRDMGKTLEISRDALRACYAGEAVIPWRDPAPATPVIIPNASGEPVSRLKAQLRQLNRITADNTGDTYDKKTATAVSRLQAETGLQVDGVAGRQVRMVLVSWLHEGDTPSLQGIKTAPAAPAPATAVPEAPKPDKPSPVETPKPEEKNADTPQEKAPAKTPAKTKTVKTTPAAKKTPPAPAPVPAETPAPTPPAPAPAEGETPSTPPPAPPAPEANAPAVQVQDLPQPEPQTGLPPANTDSLKESTPPAPGSPPLVPHTTP
jgi:general secretion pathway protein A